MNFDTLLLIGSVVITFFSALLLTNTVEYIQAKTGLASSFIGSIITPIFTSTPELVIFVTSITLVGNQVGNQIGIGTLFGQPFMTSTLAYGLVGIAVVSGVMVKKRNNFAMHISKNLSIPYVMITLLFPLLLLPGIFHSLIFQYALAILFVSSYFLFVWIMFRKRIQEEAAWIVNPILARRLEPRLAAVVQLFVVVLGLYFGSEFMVKSLASISVGVGINPLGLSILIIPIATSIPETLSAMIWGFSGRDSLSISSLVGEKVLYSTFYPALGLFIVPWFSNQYADLSIVTTTVVSLILFISIRSGRIPIYMLFTGLIFFIGYILLMFVL